MDNLSYSYGNNIDVPFVPSSVEKVIKMVQHANVQPGQLAADLGSGDGRVVIALAQAGAEAHGYEIDSGRVYTAWKNIGGAGLEDKAFIHHQSFWDANLEDFDIVTIYGITSMMGRLEEKLKKELKLGARVISNVFTFPTWEHELNDNGIYVYSQK